MLEMTIFKMSIQILLGRFSSISSVDEPLPVTPAQQVKTYGLLQKCLGGKNSKSTTDNFASKEKNRFTFSGSFIEKFRARLRGVSLR